MRFFYILIVFVFFSLNELSAQWGFDIESGLVFQSYNDVRIPNETGTLFSFTDDFKSGGNVIPIRLRVNYSIGDMNHFSFLFAPLNIDYQGEPPFDIQFQQTLFEAGKPIFGFYKFNSYRLTYRRDLLRSENWSFGLGLTAKVRDALIRLTTGTIRDNKSDLGFVPLLHTKIAREEEKWSVFLKGDALAGGPGRAIDVFIGGTYLLVDGFSVKAGYRILEGGADIDEVYNFTMIHFASLGAIWEL